MSDNPDRKHLSTIVTDSDGRYLLAHTTDWATSVALIQARWAQITGGGGPNGAASTDATPTTQAAP